MGISACIARRSFCFFCRKKVRWRYPRSLLCISGVLVRDSAGHYEIDTMNNMNRTGLAF